MTITMQIVITLLLISSLTFFGCIMLKLWNYDNYRHFFHKALLKISLIVFTTSGVALLIELLILIWSGDVL